ncbi:hypothetical protein [Pseudacidovorax intermedius]|uniref:hypothetical protein n=1 Tax=Pseudacidovorax intermedius TaxID=433924 RepID=UPI0026F10012|nr:hypothetical protein [Pseudacidovorax intermedius]
MIRSASLWILAALLAGCAAQPAGRVKLSVPVECRVRVPERPSMPTEALRLGVDVDRWVAAAQAELLLREGYETELGAALSECTESLSGL